ncbi:MAG: leucyl/phenylalanyl-tRNA--protein transferase [Rhodospirillales bacterium]|nr:leucyl/phenylalanyl-tRNA--protein transferase [Rhodospirillales bacterium]
MEIELTPDLVLRAYAAGIFPMAESAVDERLVWFDPDPRGVIPLDDSFHVPRRLARTLKQAPFDLGVDRDFDAVLANCAATRPDTWINTTIRRVYGELHRLGFAHSVETRRDGVLVGGLYGVALGGAFFGESMFATATDASKAALVHLIERLRQGGYTLLDSQFLTPHLARFGAREIPRRDYRRQLAAAIPAKADFFAIDRK